MLASPDAEQVKTGLQRACETFEGGQAFLDVGFLKVGLAAHLTSPHTKVRRWCYKLAALLRDPELIGPLQTALLGIETDHENRGWASAAFSAIASDLQRDQLTARLVDYRGTSLELAAKLYARGEPARDDLDIEVWQDEAMARKWLCLLCGYARDSNRTIDKRFDDLDLVRNCVFDDDQENVEYSIWAEHRHPAGTYRKLLVDPRNLLTQPNVRRWVYRLLTKTDGVARKHLDLLTASMNAAHEPSDVAREGLALGLAGIPLSERRLETIEWYANEESPKVRLALIDHLALLANKLDDAVARDVLTADYGRYGPAELIGAKILSVAKADWGLKAVGSVGGMAKTLITGPTELFDGIQSHVGQQSLVLFKQEIIMGNKIDQSGNNNTISGVVLGDAIQSTITALNRQENQGLQELTPLVEAFLKALAASDVDDGEKQLAVKAAEDAAKATDDEKKGKWQMFKGVVRGMLTLPNMAADAVEGGEKLVTAIGHAFG